MRLLAPVSGTCLSRRNQNAPDMYSPPKLTLCFTMGCCSTSTVLGVEVPGNVYEEHPGSGSC